MGDKTGIAWTDSTQNWWIGCTKVGPGCDHCYAVDVGKRLDVGWGAGAPRHQTREHNRNSLARYQRKAAAFLAEHGHRRRVFCSSLSDIFDNEIPDEWRAEAFADMEAAPDVLIQICTKRVSNIAKMVPPHWFGMVSLSGPTDPLKMHWPANVGILITTVTPEEITRDVPRLVELKRRFGIPWIGLSIEPMIADVADALRGLEYLSHVDWAILGGESGPQARDCHVTWILEARDVCERAGVAVFVKQLGQKARLASGTDYLRFKSLPAKEPSEWPVGHVFPREFPLALQ